MKKNLICGLLCVFALAATAQAAEYTLYWDVTQNAATAYDGSPLDLIIGTFDAGEGNLVVAIDFNLTGRFYQHWLDLAEFGLPMVVTPYQNSISLPIPADTCLLVDKDNIVEGDIVTEDNDGTKDATYNVYGWGTSFAGAIAYKRTIGDPPTVLNQKQVQPFVQVYIEAGTSFTYDISTTGGDFVGAPTIDGLPELSCSLTPDVAYARVDTPATVTSTVENIGGQTSQLYGIFPSASGEFGPGSTSTLGFLGQFETDSRQYTYTPTDRGSDTQSITVTSNGGNSHVTLSGIGVGPVFDSSIAPGSTLDFDEVLPGTPESAYLYIGNFTNDENGGDDALTDLTLLDVAIGGTDADLFEIVGFTTDTRVHKGEYVGLEIRYNGSGTAGLKNATLDIFTDEDAALGASGSIFSYNIVANVVPEPSALALLICGLLSMLLLRR